MDEDLCDFCKQMKIVYRILDIGEKGYIETNIKKKYMNVNERLGFSYFNILRFDQMVSIDMVDSWKWINDYIDNKKVIVFFNKDMGKNYIEIFDGKMFTSFYDEYSLEEFYITDFDTSFLLGYNHSQCLFALGNAADWLENDWRYLEYYKSK